MAYTVLISHRKIVNKLFLIQTGPRSGRDKVKKGGSFMCHKVSLSLVPEAV